MRYPAAYVFFLLGLAYAVLGERFLLMPLFRERNGSALLCCSKVAIRTLRCAWHLKTLAW